MSKPYKLPSFTVVVDTNAIYQKDVSNVVGQKFSELWKECAALTKLHLIIPEVVRGERLYQLTAFAQQAVDNANKSLERIVKVSGAEVSEGPKLDAVKAAIEKKFDKWVKEFGAQIAPIPYGKINWPKLVEDAVWRVKPFVAPTEEKDSEKGFRDYLILETVKELVHTANDQVVLISKDGVFREAAIAQFTAAKFAAYEDMEAFASYLKLAKEKMNQEYAQAVFQKVPQVFFTPNDPNCIYNKFTVGARIVKQFSGILDFLFNKPQPTPGLFGLSGVGNEGIFVPVSSDKIFIDSTEFVHDPKSVGVKWKTVVRFVRLFRRQGPQVATVPGLEWLNETIRIQLFNVFWTCEIDAEINFLNLNLANISAGAQTTEPSFINTAKYGLNEPPPQPQ